MNAHEIPHLDNKGLREFGLTTGAIVAGLFGLFFPWLLERSFPLWPWIILGVLAVWALIAPATLNPVYRGWMRFGLLLSRVMTPLVMGILFFLVISPVALVMRLAGRDPMQRRFDPEAASYRVTSAKPPSNKLEKPF